MSLDGSRTAPVRAALSGDLTGVILEITEDTDLEATPWLADEVQSFRDRGAIVAVDDWGRGYSNLDRVLLMRPEIVKIDMSLVHNLDLDYHPRRSRRSCDWADLVGARICAEGVETEEQWRQLRAIGVHLGQGWFFGAPAAPGSDAAPDHSPRRSPPSDSRDTGRVPFASLLMSGTGSRQTAQQPERGADAEGAQWFQPRQNISTSATAVSVNATGSHVLRARRSRSIIRSRSWTPVVSKQVCRLK